MAKQLAMNTYKKALKYYMTGVIKPADVARLCNMQLSTLVKWIREWENWGIKQVRDGDPNHDYDKALGKLLKEE